MAGEASEVVVQYSICAVRVASSEVQSTVATRGSGTTRDSATVESLLQTLVSSEYCCASLLGEI